MAALCVALVWATQEGRVARPLGGHRRVPRREPRNPWVEKIRRMMACVGTWLMKISVPQAEPSQGTERRRTRANPDRRSGSSTYREAAPRQGRQNEARPQGGPPPRQGRQHGARSQREPAFLPTRQGGTRGPRSNPNGPSYVVRMGNANRAALSVFMDGLEVARAQGEPPAPPYASSDVPNLGPTEEPEEIPDLVPIEEPEAALPVEEGLSPSARARLEQARSEIARNQQ
jgi:hypothetical protein